MGAVIRKAALKGKDPVVVTVSTGDVKAAGTDNDVMIRFNDKEGKGSQEFKLDNIFRDDFEPGRTDEFILSDIGDIGEISSIEIWREGLLDDDLFLNVVRVKRVNTGTEYVFPVHRWIPKKERLRIREFDCYLPWDDADPEKRREELDWKRQVFDLHVKAPGLPVQCSSLPEEQSFSTDYQWDLRAKKRKLFLVSKMQVIKSRNWKTVNDLKNLYTSKTLPLPKPAVENWHLKDDCFGEQRLAGCNPFQIKLCTAIPQNFAVTSEMIEPFLEGKTLSEALESKRLFLTDYSLLEGLQITSTQLKLVAPLGLFFLSDAGKLLPVAIQLEQTPRDTNPVFLPSDPPFTWMMAKMWFNLADASMHQAKAHLGFTHLIAETICVVTHRHLSPSHPIFRLLAPHFLYLLAINHRALDVLVSPGGWIDNTMTIGRLGVFDIVRKSFATWRMDVEGTLPEDIKTRGVGPDVLPYYPYRDDAMPIYDIIKDYVTTVVLGHYGGSDTRLTKDHELQAWAKELSTDISDGGAGLQGVPGRGKIENTEDLIQILTSTIFISSVQHAAANFNQYEQYAFPAVYPAQLKGQPPSSKAPLVEADILAALPGQDLTGNIMLVTSILSSRGTNALGDFEVQYGYDGIAQKALTQFQEDLKKAREAFLERNRKRDYSYTVLDPAEIPNAISI